jgi:hypothetical protein
MTVGSKARTVCQHTGSTKARKKRLTEGSLRIAISPIVVPTVVVITPGVVVVAPVVVIVTTVVVIVTTVVVIVAPVAAVTARVVVLR